MAYDRLGPSELRGATQADYLIALDADLRVVVGDKVVYEEPGFPVVELARSFKIWLAGPDRRDFVFDSMSFEEVGAVAFRQTPEGWVFSSVFAPVGPPIPLDWADRHGHTVGYFIPVKTDVAALKAADQLRSLTDGPAGRVALDDR